MKFKLENYLETSIEFFEIFTTYLFAFCLLSGLCLRERAGARPFWPEIGKQPNYHHQLSRPLSADWAFACLR